jgi:PAS domain S-box-containing protein
VAAQLRGVARRTALTYLIAAALWILLSDRAVGLLTSDPHVIEWLSISKGWLFVLVTAALLYFALRKQLLRTAVEAEARQQAAEALAEAEARQRLFIEHAPAALAMFDRQMRYIAVSRRWLADYQLSGRDVIGKSHYEVLPEISEPVKEIHRRCLAGEVLSAKADPFTRADGRVQWLRWEARPWLDAKGEIGGIVIFSEDITERIMAEARLRESEARFRSVVEGAPLAIFLQAGGRFAYLNPAALVLFGAKTAAELVGQPVLDRFHPADHPMVLERIRRLNQERRVVSATEEHLVRCDGTVIDAEVAGVPFRVDDKAGALVFAHDITAQKLAHEQLRLQETVLRETSEIAKVGGWSFDPATGEGIWTEEVARIHGLDPADKTSVSRGVSFYSGESRRRIEAALKAAVEQRQSYDLVLELVTAGGVRKWVRTIGYPIVAEDKVVRVRGAFQDVTELYEATAALRESVARFRELAETINEVFWINDPETGRQLYVSPAYERIWGVSCASLYASPRAWITSIQEEDRPRVATAIARLPETGEYGETYRILRPDGGIRWIHDRGFPVRDETGRAVRLVGVAEDITEKKRMESQFLRTQRLEAVGALADGVAHDLNNILTPILMSTGILKEESSAENLALLSMIEQSARRGAEIVQQLLTFSRGAEGERIVLQPRHLIREMATLVREAFPKTIQLEVKVAADLWTVEANSTQLHQVLMNLCVNARDAMPEGGQLILSASNIHLPDVGHTQCANLSPGPYVLIGVADSGEGMTPETQARLFEPFFTTKAPGKGTGLGLSTVLGIVRSHGGQVSVYSEHGHGSRFMVYLPALPGVVEAEMPPAATQEFGHGELILIVDDEPTIREATSVLLQKNGYKVLAVGDGDAALALALQHAGALRLVLTDVFMPGMDGIALARALKAIAPGIAVIASSGLDKPEKRRELEEIGVREILGKPCASAALLAAIRRALETKA